MNSEAQRGLLMLRHFLQKEFRAKDCRRGFGPRVELTCCIAQLSDPSLTLIARNVQLFAKRVEGNTARLGQSIGEQNRAATWL